ncbi:hypothetical protein EMIHUDRAFT_222693 [Emiliania huxleyi CCMP1516]|uniref:Uncharacterized protein n=2 Tax=Emiliania huxleyi TaxID=2903 RepID=A0A0D3KXU0_EMIH1|nr:hypothetical protein EMIHUDRAFT_222693 [Emiliania huxleyi CCMP1516]EOD40575.1 hypothetical protein EMIHUDRAFT_222693 [Emiliania huxleyi CCMP1516]|eukprot:XP_005793004.1 hypothetical protein EMIHUDRAFT_222693 [Emiliania huxleyi CCMP1516]
MLSKRACFEKSLPCTAAPTQPVTDLGVDESKLEAWFAWYKSHWLALEPERRSRGVRPIRSGPAVHASRSGPKACIILFAVQHARLARASAAKKLKNWRKHGGGDLEPVLASGAVALLDAQWIISHAEAGGVLAHRQALPKEAFLSLADLAEATDEDDFPVAALSYPWLTKDHPDPRGANLSRVARALKALLTDSHFAHSPLTRLGVFWDFGSLHQHPDPAHGVERTEEQNALFKQGLGCLGTLYSNPQIFVLRLTSFPDGHNAEDQAEGTNVATYFDRGWCFCENSWASLTKDGRLSLDLGKMRDGVEYDWGSLTDDCTQDGGRRPPLLPSAFAAELESKSFTNGKDDKPLEQFGKVTVLIYGDLGWGDAEVAQLAEVLASGAAPRLEKLWLNYNQIGDEGCKALAAALGKEGAVPRLETLSLVGNKIGDEGCKALAAAIGKEGTAPRLETLYLEGNQIGEEGCKALAAPSLKARDEPLAARPSPAQCSSRLPSRADAPVLRAQMLRVVGWENKVQPELAAVCEERGIDV